MVLFAHNATTAAFSAPKPLNLQQLSKLMKKLMLSIAVICAITANHFAQDRDKLPTINVTGSADISVAPDEVLVSLDVTKRNKVLQTAKSEADVALAKIIQLTKQFDIKPENVRTDYISVEMKYQSIRDPKNRIYDEDGDEVGTRVFLGYEVSTTVIVKLTDIKRFEGFFSEVLKTGLSEIDSVKFETSKLREHKDKAREMAMKAAFEKASAMAGAINQTIGKAIFIVEGTPPNPSYSGANSNTTANYYSGPVTVSEPVATFAPGAIKINAQVTVTFLLN